MVHLGYDATLPNLFHSPMNFLVKIRTGRITGGQAVVRLELSGFWDN